MNLPRKEWKPYFEALAARMRLGNWAIAIADDPPRDEANLASVHRWHGRCFATIRLADSFLTDTEEEQRDTAVHELVHCYFAHADKLVEAALFGPAFESWSLAREYGIDAIVGTLAPFLPLPSEILKPRGQDA